MTSLSTKHSILVAIIASLIAITAASIAAAYTTTVDKEIRITARLLEEERRVEFGLQERTYGDQWAYVGGSLFAGDKVLPDRNKFPLDTDDDRWLNSASVELSPPGSGMYARIVARHTENDAGNPRVEFGLQVRGDDEPYGEKVEEHILLPEVRLFNYRGTRAREGGWLYSSRLSIPMFERVSEGTWPWTSFTGSNADGDYVGYYLTGTDKTAEWPYSNLAEMYVRCLEGERSIHFVTDTPIYGDSSSSNSVSVRYRVSGAETQRDDWGLARFGQDYVFADIEPWGSFALYVDTHYAPGRTLFVDFSSRFDEHQLEFTLTGLHAVLRTLSCF